MTVVQTDRWLLETYDDPIALCERTMDYFDNVSSSEIYHHLMSYGMYRVPLINGIETITKLQHNKVWNIVKKEALKLQQLWMGPDIPIFIFPSDANNGYMKQNFNGKSGLAFRDKLFLFISEDNTEKEIRALFTHEYNHVCRLAHFLKDEKDYVLLDSILLEGLAESAVRERLGEKHTASWTSYYPSDELENMWDKMVLPYKDLSRNHRRHMDILYGLQFYPKMLGYCTGYYLVQKYMEANHLSVKDLLSMSSDEMI